MCLALPGKVMSIDAGSTPMMGDVNFGGVMKRICLDWVPDIAVGEYVIVHVGFALNKVDEKEALETIRLFQDIEDASERQGD